MRSHRLHRLDDNTSAASCQQAGCKLILNTFYPRARCKLFQQLAASLQISSCIKSDFHRLDGILSGKFKHIWLMQLYSAQKLSKLAQDIEYMNWSR